MTLAEIMADSGHYSIDSTSRSNRRVTIDYDRTLYKQRNRSSATSKINRAIATRYDQLANSFLGTASSAWSISPPPDTGSNSPP
ncbi:hypothetical protein [Sphingomonas sp.]|uniref:hypothetical protein n=1 Tax=Sphingomonas sp. TaxID=28214 RepID=UPI001EC5E019|nr:hypothetical protein [Sphingomonas sp.]MBX3594740.1 hypothetical protein [Sphingomonas sp.]